MEFPLEAVTNFSEARDAAVVKAMDPGKRSSSTSAWTSITTARCSPVVGSEHELVDALFAGIACAVKKIDLRGHGGVRPRIGAADVVPIVPIRPHDAPRAAAAALKLARRVGEELDLPVFLYADIGRGHGPASLGAGASRSCSAASDTGEVAPDFGPCALIRQAASS